MITLFFKMFCVAMVTTILNLMAVFALVDGDPTHFFGLALLIVMVGSLPAGFGAALYVIFLSKIEKNSLRGILTFLLSCVCLFPFSGVFGYFLLPSALVVALFAAKYGKLKE